MIQNPIYILAFLCFLIFLSEWLCKYTKLKHLSSSLLVILLGAVFANFGLIPSASNATPVYDAIFQYVAPASIFFLLLGVNLKQLKQAGMPMLIAFGVGA
ncbi:MAG: putative membrane protein, partial [Nonlabens sp.]